MGSSQIKLVVCRGYYLLLFGKILKNRHELELELAHVRAEIKGIKQDAENCSIVNSEDPMFPNPKQ